MASLPTIYTLCIKARITCDSWGKNDSWPVSRAELWPGHFHAFSKPGQFGRNILSQTARTVNFRAPSRLKFFGFSSSMGVIIKSIFLGKNLPVSFW
ncbi:hypothetical protein CDAR_387091 [Caerostris darwini]|uniref:Uncharacterized protein n=1 Tax=Caerostris darwini TaxID=1538125 RepID=A0AAV4RR33_9ARAC|nr:hypothetical protein CDAR_387091 [Caerostris darwini]